MSKHSSAFAAITLIAAFVFTPMPYLFASQTEPSTTSVNAPYYWQGWTTWPQTARIYITVYRTEGQCESFYAVITKYAINGNTKPVNSVEAWVKKHKNGNYYVTYKDTDYFFSM